MTRKDYEKIAAILRETRPEQYPGEPLTNGTTAAAEWIWIVGRFAVMLADDSGYDLNGNRRFDRERFWQAVHR